MSAPRIITIPADDDGQRLDRWIKKNVPDLPYGLVQKLLRKGQIRVNGKRAKPDQKLIAGQELRLPAKDQASGQIANASAKPPVLSEKDRAFIRSLVIYEDNDVIALNKPHGLATQGGTNMTRHIDGMLDGLKNKDGVRPRLVHRLDKDTSGVLLLARSAQSAKALGHIFKGREAKKIYWALTLSVPEIYEGTVTAPLKKAGGTNKERMRIDDEEGKSAITDYKVIETANTEAAFITFWPRTGRTHQIRAHAEFMNCPILGDPKYKKRKTDHAHEVIDLSALNLAGRLHLHAYSLQCPHPSGKGADLNITAPMPDDLRKSWQEMGFDPDFDEDPFLDLS